MKNFRRILALFLIALPMVGVWSVVAHEEEIPQVTIDVTGEGYTLPEVVPEGVVQVTFTNNSEASASLGMARLNEGVTEEALMSAMAEAGPFGVLQLVSLVGGGSVESGETSIVTFDLKPGTYLLLDTNEGAPPPSMFVVADGEGEGAGAPEADAQVSLLDFAFSVPMHVEAGEQTWEIQNNGGQWHEMVIMKLEDDTTIAEMNELVGQVMSSEDPSTLPVQQVGFVFPIGGGERTWLDLDLEAGSYVAICFLPDFATGMAHLEHGMIQVFNVVEAE